MTPCRERLDAISPWECKSISRDSHVEHRELLAHAEGLEVGGVIPWSAIGLRCSRESALSS